MTNSVLQRSPSVFMVSETSEYFCSDGARAVAVSNVPVCFHGLVRLWPRWLVCPAVSCRSVVKPPFLLLPYQPTPSPLLTGSDFPPGRRHSSAQLEFMTSYHCGPPVRPSYSLRRRQMF